MPSETPHTEFVRRILEDRQHAPDAAYGRDLLALERLASGGPLGVASALALSNLMSRYPREADAILGERGVRPFEDLEGDRVGALVAERLRLAEMRHPLRRLRHEERYGFFEF